jgi:DNA-binding MarR family transcriptional regulator
MDDDPLALGNLPPGSNRVSLALQRLARELRADLNRVISAHSDINIVDFRIFNHLALHDWASQKALVASVRVEQGQVSRSLMALQQRALIVSRVDPADKRSRQFSLMPAGRALHGRLLPVIRAHNATIGQTLSPPEIAWLLETMTRFAIESRASADAIAAKS